MQVYVLNDIDVDSTEQIWLTVGFNGGTLAVGVVHRPPRHSVIEFLNIFENCLSTMSMMFDRIVCCGDFNIDFLQMDAGAARCLQSILDSYGLNQTVTEPTRIGKTKFSLLDLFLCTESIDVMSCVVLDSTGITSDHSFVVLTILENCNVIHEKIVTVRDYKNINDCHFNDDLMALPFYDIFYTNELDIKLNVFNRLLLLLFDKHAPFKTFRVSKNSRHSPWITDNVKLLIKLRNKALSRFKRSKLPAHWSYYKQLRNFTTTAIKHEKKAYLNFAINRNKTSKTLFNELKKLNIYSKRKQEDLPNHLLDLNEINAFFINSTQTDRVADEEILNSLQYSIRQGVGSFNFVMVTELEVLDALLSIKSDAIGADGISLRMIRLCCPYILRFITHLINFSIETNSFPSEWKTAHVIPLPKVKNPNELKDLRPISILPALSKVFERVLYNQLKVHVQTYSIIPDNQSGFRSMHSCTTAVLTVVDDIIEAVDKDQLTTLVLLDYSKAFDRINHSLMLAVMHNVGFSADASMLISSYIGQRFQLVKYNNKLSNAMSIKSGVPQGSILGPLLFSVYISSFKDCLIHCKSHFYADDTQLYLSCTESQFDECNNFINEDLTSLHTLSQQYCLELNSAKSQVMLFGRRSTRERCSSKVKIGLDGVYLNLINVSKNLGIYLDSNLRFEKHINMIIRNSFSYLKLIYSNLGILNFTSKVTLCEALVLSRMNYCDIVYGPCITIFDSNRLQRVQNSCVRLIYGLRRRDRVSERLRELGWLNIQKRRFLHCCSLLYNIYNHRIPSYLYNKIIFKTNIHNVNLRSKSLIVVPKHQTAFYQRSYTYVVSKILNVIIPILLGCSLREFRAKLKQLLLSSSLTIPCRI